MQFEALPAILYTGYAAEEAHAFQAIILYDVFSLSVEKRVLSVWLSASGLPADHDDLLPLRQIHSAILTRNVTQWRSKAKPRR